jgi:catechol 2,3-dioxygenase-like lactoylglutathione lyase family enzyme
MLKGLDRLLLRVSSVPAAAKYWANVMGMTLVRQGEGLALLRFKDAPGEVLLHNDPDLPAEGVYLLVDDVRAIYEQRAKHRLTFLGRPARVARGFRATVKDPFGIVLLLIDRACVADEQQPAAEDARAGGVLFPGVRVPLRPRRGDLVRLYEAIGRTADDLPYTPQFEKFFEEYAATFDEPQPDRAEAWRHLLNIRKRGDLPKLGEARSQPPSVSPEDRQRLLHALGDDRKTRDRLPYTRRFEELTDIYNRGTDRPLNPHQLWRLIATLAK